MTYLEVVKKYQHWNEIAAFASKEEALEIRNKHVFFVDTNRGSHTDMCQLCTDKQDVSCDVIIEEGRLLEERYEKTEDVKDKSQIGASFAGVGNPYFDIGNAAASFGRSIDATIGLNRPRSFSDAVKHLKGAAYNTAAVLNIVPPAGGKAFDFIKGGKDLGKSLTFQGDKASDVIRSLGNLGYWFDRDTGTLGGVASQIEGKDKTKK